MHSLQYHGPSGCLKSTPGSALPRSRASSWHLCTPERQSQWNTLKQPAQRTKGLSSDSGSGQNRHSVSVCCGPSGAQQQLVNTAIQSHFANLCTAGRKQAGAEERSLHTICGVGVNTCEDPTDSNRTSSQNRGQEYRYISRAHCTSSFRQATSKAGSTLKRVRQVDNAGGTHTGVTGGTRSSGESLSVSPTPNTCGEEQGLARVCISPGAKYEGEHVGKQGAHARRRDRDAHTADHKSQGPRPAWAGSAEKNAHRRTASHTHGDNTPRHTCHWGVDGGTTASSCRIRGKER